MTSLAFVLFIAAPDGAIPYRHLTTPA
jgi:hypothetical protein